MLDSLSPSSSPPSSFSPTHPSSPEFSSPPHPALPPPPVDYTDKLYIRNLLLFSALSLHIHTPPLACWDKTACLCSTTCACVLPARDALPKSCADSKMTQHLSQTWVQVVRRARGGSSYSGKTTTTTTRARLSNRRISPSHTLCCHGDESFVLVTVTYVGQSGTPLKTKTPGGGDGKLTPSLGKERKWKKSR